MLAVLVKRPRRQGIPMTIGRTWLVLTLFSASIAGWGPPLEAAERPALPAGKRLVDPQELMRRMFGEETEADRAALEQVEISREEERKIGQAALQAFLAEMNRQGIRVVSRGREVEYLRDLVEMTKPLMTRRDRYRTISVYLADAPPCEAKSFPGGTLVFFQGMLDAGPSEAALVGAVGHELAHLDRGHQLTRARRFKLAQQTLSGQRAPAFSPEQFFASGTAMMRLWTRPFSPEDEATADRDGARWAYVLGYDPRELAKLVEKLPQRRFPPVPVPDFLQSHPDPERRAKAILDEYEKLQQADPKPRLYVGEENLRRRIARSRRAFRR